MVSRPVYRRSVVINSTFDDSPGLDANLITTTEDFQTLIRTIIDIFVLKDNSNTTEQAYEWMIHIAPNGVDVADACTTVFRTVETTDEELVRKAGHFIPKDVGTPADTFIPTQKDHFKEDLKMMRRLREDDVIKIAAVSDQALNVRIVGTIIFFFKA